MEILSIFLENPSFRAFLFDLWGHGCVGIIIIFLTIRVIRGIKAKQQAKQRAIDTQRNLAEKAERDKAELEILKKYKDT